jgi:hypothetical protein
MSQVAAAGAHAVRAAVMALLRRYGQWAWRTQHGIRGGRVVKSQVDRNSATLAEVVADNAKLRARVSATEDRLNLFLGAVVQACDDTGIKAVSPAAKTVPQIYLVRDNPREEAS